jgi:predicted anti-sigma-YlaC factor YlaD
MKLLLDCRAVAGLLSASLEEAAPLPDRARMRWHLLVCPTCRTVEEQMHFLRAAMQRAGPALPDEKLQAPNPR